MGRWDLRGSLGIPHPRTAGPLLSGHLRPVCFGRGHAGSSCLKKMLRSVHVPGPDRSHRPSSLPMPSLTEHLKIEGPLLRRKDSYFVSCDKAVLGSNVTPQKMGISTHHSPKEKTGPCGYMTVFSLSSTGSLWVVRTPGLPGAAVTCPSLSRAETGGPMGSWTSRAKHRPFVRSYRLSQR